MSADGNITIGTAIDTSGFEEGAAKMQRKVEGLTANIEKEGERINKILSQSVPTFNIDLKTNSPKTMQEVERASEQLKSVFEANRSALRTLDPAYVKLTNRMKELNRNLNAPGFYEEYQAVKQQREALRENIQLRQGILEETEKTSEQLIKIETKIRASAEASNGAEKKQVSLRTQLRNVREELVAMEQQGLRNTAQYKDLQQKAGQLTDAWSDASKQASVLAHDQRGFQGVIAGLSGVSGAFSAAQGAVALFSDENEDLQKMMLKVQSLMSITMGLQQVQAALDKDSAFRLVTINGLKEWWNKLLAVGRGEQVASTAATVLDTAATDANTASTISNTAATNAQAGAVAAATKARIGLAGVGRMVGAGIKSLLGPTGLIIAAIGAIVGAVMLLTKRSREASKRFKEQQETIKGARADYVKAADDMSRYARELKRSNLTKSEELKLTKELNSKYGESLGYHKSTSEWYKTLARNGQAYIDMLFKQAEAEAYLNKYTEARVKLMELESKRKRGKASQREVNEAKKEADFWGKLYTETTADAQGIRDKNGLGYHSEFDYEAAALQRKNVSKNWAKERKQFIKETEDAITDYTINAMADGLAKELRQIEISTERKKRALNNSLIELGAQKKAEQKALYMSREGATEVGWANSAAGRKSDRDYGVDLYSNDPTIKNIIDTQAVKIAKETEEAKKKVREQYNEEYIQQYGTYQQKVESLTKKWVKELAALPPEFLSGALKVMDKEFEELEKSDPTNVLIAKYQTYGDKRKEIEEKYNRDIAELRKQGMEENAKIAEKERDKALFALDLENIEALKTAFVDIEHMTKDRLVKNLEVLRTKLKEVTNPEQIKLLQEQIAKTEDAIDGQWSRGFSTNWETAIRNMKKAADYADKAKKATGDQQKAFEAMAEGSGVQALLDGVGASLSSVLNIFQNVASALQDVATATGDEALSEKAEVLDGVADGLSSILQGFSSGGFVGGALAAVKVVVNGIIDIWATAKKEQAEYERYQADFRKEMLMAALTVKDAENLFGSKILMRAQDAAMKARRALSEYRRDVAALGDMQIKVFDKSWFANLFGDEDISESLKSIASEIFEDGLLNVDAARAFLDANEKLTDEQRKQIENAIALAEKYEDAMAVIEETVSDFVGGVADDISTELWDAVARGEDAWDKWQDAGSEAISKLGKQMLSEMIQTAWLEKYKDRLIGAFGGTSGEDPQQVMNDLFQNLGSLYSTSKDFTEQYQSWMKDQGYDLIGESERTSTSEGIAQASQASVDENNARLTTIQMHTFSIAEGMKTLQSNSSAILTHVMGIHSDTGDIKADIARMREDVRLTRSGIDDINLKGINIKS